MKYSRYAVYFLPEPGPLAAFGARWLGWDVEDGAPVAQFPVEGIEDATETPRKYGFHATLKPPFRLAEGTRFEDLKARFEALAGATAPAIAEGLDLTSLGGFLALTPRGDQSEIARVAAACVTELDSFRAPAPPAELARRRASGLTEAQEAHLQAWGYPYVLDAFRFHMTLTGRLDDAGKVAFMRAARAHLPALPEPFRLSHIALAGERADRCFELVHRVALTG